MPNQVSEKIKQERLTRAMIHQQKISEANNLRMMGQTVEVLVEGRDENNPDCWLGRSWMDAPEVDGNVFIRSAKPLAVGSFYPVQITSVAEYDLLGKI